MAKGPARIDSPEVILEFRRRYVAFDEVVRNALMGIETEVRTTANWLRGDALMEWKRRQRKAEELMNSALRELRRAQMNTQAGQKASHVDEKKTYEKAKRVKEEADQKIEAAKKWSVALEQKAAKILGPCRAFGSRMDSMTPRALQRLDIMITSLQDYLSDRSEGE
jgi:ribosomal protein L17